MRTTPAPEPETLSQQASKPDAAARWFLFAASSVLLLLFSGYAIQNLLDSTQTPYRVFGTFWASGQATSQHLNPYGVYPLTWRFHAPDKQGPLIDDVNLSAPFLLPFSQLLARFPLRTGVVAWTVFSCLLFIGGAALLLAVHRGRMQKRQLLWLFFAWTIYGTLLLGQNYSLMYAAACLIWALRAARGSNSRTTLATDLIPDLLIGLLIAMKPNLGLWPVMLFVAGYRRNAVRSAVTAALLSAFPLLLYGPAVYRQWLQASAAVPHYLLALDVSLAGTFSRLGLPRAGLPAAIVVALALILVVARLRPSLTNIAGIAICAGILCAPLGWHHYTLFAAPFFTARRWAKLETAAAILLGLPPAWSVVKIHPNHTLSLIAVPYIAGLLLLLASFVRSAIREAHTPTPQEL